MLGKQSRSCFKRARPLYYQNGYLTHALNATDYRGFANGEAFKANARCDSTAADTVGGAYSEQHVSEAKIDELFSDLDASVTALKRARTNLKRYRAAVLKAAVEGKLTAEWRKANPLSEPRDVTSIHVTGPYELPRGGGGRGSRRITGILNPVRAFHVEEHCTQATPK